MKYPTAFIVFIAIIISCNNNSNTKSNTPLSSDGIWQQEGYGTIFEIKGDSVKIYDICSIDCGLSEHILLKEKGKIKSFSDESMTIQKNIKSYEFKRLDKLPKLCSSPHEDALSPIKNFEVLWTTFNENYCYFKERNINWQEKYQTYKSKITEETRDLELYSILNEMLSSMDDNHVKLHAPESIQYALDKLEEENEETSDEIKQVVDHFKMGDLIADKYCKNHKSYNAGMAKWGIMENNIAYIQVNAMWLMADYNLDKNLSLNEFGSQYMRIASERIFQRQDEIDGAKIIMDSIFTDTQSADALIIDLRFNGGGKDEVGLEIIGHLVDKKTKVASKKTRLADSFVNQQDIFLEKRTPHYNKNVYLLSSMMSASATELATMSTTSLDKVTRIGSATEGIFSDGLDKKLPNGWYYTLSNEIYLDLGGNNYEGKGIAPNIEMNYPRDRKQFINTLYAQLNSTGDLAIEKVFDLEKK